MAKKYQSGSKLFLWRFKKQCIVFWSFLRKHIFATLISILGILILSGIGVGIYSIYNSPSFKITKVQVELDEYALQYKNSISKFLEQDFIETNTVSSFRYRLKFLPYYKNKYQRIETIQTTSENHTLSFKIYGKKPILYYTLYDNVYAQLNNTEKSVYPMNDGFKPDAFTGSFDASGSLLIPSVELLISKSLIQSGFDVMYYGLSAEALIKQIQIIHASMKGYIKMEYLPGGGKLIVKLKNNITVYFDLKKNVFEQLRKYEVVSSLGLRAGAVIDIGTMDELVFVQ